MKRTISLLLTLLMLLSVLPFSSFALSWDGSSAGGSTNAVNGNNTGYVIRSTKDDECVVGYRFSVVNAEGNNKVSKVIDVFRKTTNGGNAYSTSYKFSAKYNKKQLIANKDGKMTTTKNTTNCYKEANLKFLTALPNPSGVETWQAYEQNINQVLTTLGVGTVANMVYGDKVLIEPLFDTCLAGEYQALTVTEIAYCGRSVLGGSSDGGTSNGTSSTWGFIANYTNRIWPNKLFTPDGQGLWTAASTIASSKKASFNVILGRGYGVGIAYNETQNLTYTIAFNGNGNTGGSTASMTMAKDESKKLTANGFTKTGNSFTGWNTKANGSGTSYTNKQSVKNLSSTNGATITLYAQWTPYVLKVYFNANGGTPSNTTSNGTTYYNKVVSSSNQNMIHSSSKSETAAFYQTFRYNTAKDFANASSFGLSRTGYTFAGWNTNAGGTGTTYDQTTEYTPTTLASNLSSGDRTLTLYAKWTPVTYTVSYNANGGSGAPGNQTKTYGVDLTLSSTKPTRTGYTFNGWNTNSSGTGTNYASGGKYTGNAALTLYAKWTPNTYTVTYNANGGSGAPGSQTKTHGVNLTLSSTKPTRIGYTFVNWNTASNGTGTTYASGGTYSGNANLTLYAQWTPVTYTVTYNANGGTGAPGSQTKTHGVNLTLSSTKPTRTGYTFVNWNTSSNGTGTSYASGSTYSGNANLTLYAQWTPVTYTVTYNANGGSGAPGDQTKTYGVNLTLSSTKPTRTGYTFVNWNTASNGTGTSYASGGTYSGNANLTLYAQWTPVTYTVTYNANGGSGAPGNQTKTHGVNLTLSNTKPTRTGHTFASWNTSSAGYGTTYNPGSTYSGNANLTLYAQWTPVTYTVTYNANCGTGAPGNQTKTHDVNLTLSSTKPTRTGYTFVNWSTASNGTGTSYASGGTYSGNANLTLYAQWTPNNYTIVFDGNGATGGSTASMSMKSDESKNLTANGFYKTGHSFKNWNTQANGNGMSYADQQSVKNLAANGSGTVTLYAQWTPDTYKVHYDANGGTGAPGDQTKTYGVSLTLSATKPTRTGYTFQNWNTKADGSGATYASGALYTANAALTLYAQWKINTYTVTYNANGGAGAPSSQTKTYGIDLTLSSVTPSRTGYSFKNWNTAANGSGTSYAPGSNYTGNANLTLYAQWIPNTYVVSYDANGGTGAPASQTKTHDIDLTLSSVKPTRTGYSFTGWNTRADGNGVSYPSGAVYKGNTNLALYAQWQPIQYTIVFDGNGHTAGSTASMTMQYNESKPLTENGFIKTDHRFTGWNTSADGTGTDYTDKQTVQNLSTTDGATITLYAQWIEGRLLRLEAIAPNAPYREGTDVISGFHLINEGTGDCVPSDQVSVRFHVFEDDTIIKTVELTDVVVPANEQNLLYFKWSVPTGLSDKLISISGEIIENGSSYGAIRYAYTTCAYVVSSTPDTQYEASAPADFEAPEELPQSYSDSKTWSIWTYEAAGFRKRDYGIGYADSTPQITPDLTANATQADGVWTMKSGYGVTMSLDNGVSSLSGCTMPALDAYTLPQYAEAFFPEYGYLHGADQYRTLELSSNVWRFRQNGSYGYVHFTPLWYPDGSYTVSVRQSDLWTPAGMIQKQSNTNTVVISGSAYDDWYIH